MNSLAQRDTFCLIDGVNIRLWTAGSGPEAILLTHGLGGSIEAWAENIEPLSKEYTVYAVELPGLAAHPAVRGPVCSMPAMRFSTCSLVMTRPRSTSSSPRCTHSRTQR